MDNCNREAEENAVKEVLENELSPDSEPKSEEEKITEYEPKDKFEKRLYNIYRNENLAEMLKISSYGIVALTVYAFLVRILSLVENRDYIQILELALITGIPFIVVTLVREFINAPRPYELLEFYENKPKGKEGRSFPSRHVFSVFVISVAIMPWNLFLGIGLSILGVVLATIRVLLGIHFIRDVVAGAIIGAVSGALGLLIIYLI